MKQLYLLVLVTFGALNLNAQFENFTFRSVPTAPGTVLSDFSESGKTIIKGDNQGVDPILVAMLDATLEEEKNRTEAVAFSASLILPDGDAWTGAIGQHDGTTGTLITPDMVSGVGSVTKTITGACIMQLRGEGKLSLDDSLGKYLPSFPNVKPEITIRQLLNHTSGIYNYTDNPNLNTRISQNYARVWQPDEILNNFVLAPLFNPGDNWAYSNTNYVLLGLIIEEITGESYEVAIRNRFFTPLGLEGIYLYPQETPVEVFVNLWADLFGGGTPNDLAIFGISRAGLFSAGWAAGAVISKPETIARWMKLLTDGEVIAQAELTDMSTFLPITNSYGYGLGLSRWRLPDNRFVFGHGGNIIYQSEVHAIPDLGISIAVLTNDGTQPGVEETWYALYQTYLEYLQMVNTNEKLPVSALNTYPNPVMNQLQIDFEGKEVEQIEVFNAVGSLVYRVSGPFAGQYLMDTKDWNSGLYIMNATGKEGIYQSRIIKN
jgi:D-alanyl-D-alanine carboxypeptidase